MNTKLNDAVIQEAIESKAYWRAREILRSRIRNVRFDQELYWQYAELLVKMHDDLEAGKYYFLSGVRTPDNAYHIQLFLRRFASKKLGSITSQFPARATYNRVADYPEPIQSEIENLGLEDPPLRDQRLPPEQARSSWRSRVFDLAFYPMIIFVLISIPFGMYTIIKWLLSLIW